MQAKKTEALLINPRLPYPRLCCNGVDFYSRIWPPLDLLNASDLLSKNGVSNRILDAHAKRLGTDKIAKACKRADKAVVTTSTLDRWQCPYPSLPGLRELILSIKDSSPSTEVILFGAHSTLNPGAALNRYNADKAVCGDETGILKAVTEPGRIARGGETDINATTPDYAGTEPRDYIYELLGDRLCLLETSRGCAHSCSFCFKGMHGQYREKRQENTLRELENAYENGYKRAYFIDLNFCCNRKRTASLCRQMKKERIDIEWTCQTRVDSVDRELLALMRSAGCKLVHLGIETNSERQLLACKKGISSGKSADAVRLCKEAGLETTGFFLMGFPNQTEKEWARTIGFAEKIQPDYASLRVVTPYKEWTTSPYKATYLNRDQLATLNKMILHAYLKAYLNPRKLAKIAGKISIGHLKMLKEAAGRIGRGDLTAQEEGPDGQQHTR